MKCSPALASWLFGLCVAMAGCVAVAEEPGDAEPPQIAFEGRRGSDISIAIAAIDDQHQFSQRVYAYAISSTHADFDGATAMNYAQSDSGPRDGTHRGYAIWTLKNGDTLTMKFEGTHEIPQGAGMAPNGGKLEFVGGTGKYRGVKGSGTYSGTGSPTEGMFKGSATLTF